MRRMYSAALAVLFGCSIGCSGSDPGGTTVDATDAGTDGSTTDSANTTSAQTSGTTNSASTSATTGMTAGATSSTTTTGNTTSDVGSTGGSSGGPETSSSSDGTSGSTGAMTSGSSSGDSSSSGDGSSSGGGSSGGCVEQPWYPDGDNDGYGDGEPMESCEQPEGYVEQDGDCDDNNIDVNPGLDEKCDNQDNDCDGVVDEGSPQNNFCDECEFVQWDQDPDTYYAYCNNHQTWFNAQSHCEGLGGHLVTIKSAQENIFVGGLLLEWNIWIGLDDQDVEGDFNWVDGDNLGWENWDIFQPDDGGLFGDEDCTEMRQSLEWNDLPCGNDLPFVCEHPA